MNVGLRVVRGKDWQFGDQDGGEGRVGTVMEVGGGGVSNGPKKTVVVLWDGGVRANYRAGLQGCNDLRVLDNGPAGTVHEDVTCDGCRVSNIRGIRWKCTQCDNFDLCHICYHSSKHDMSHTFYRIDTSTSQRILVLARNGSRKVQAKGTYVGARVTRGANWVYANQDGGSDKQGTVIEVTSVTNSSARSCVKIKWDAGGSNNYRRGHEGKVEVKCSKDKEGNGEIFFVEHLPLLGDYAFNLIDKDDWVKLNESKLSAVDKLKMIAHLGQVARVLALVSQSASVRFTKAPSFTIPVFMLTKLRRFIRSDVVKITESLQDAKRWQVGHGGWNEAMAGALGKTGKVLKVDSDGDVKVLVNSKNWVLNPASCTLVSEATGVDQDDDQDSDDASSDAFLQLMQLLMGVQGITADVSPNALVQEAAKGNVERVGAILARNPSQVDTKVQERTALHVASHEGHQKIVLMLLQAGAKPENKDDDGDTAYHYAIYGNRPEVLEVLLKKSRIHVDSVNKAGNTPLHIAVGKQQKGCVEMLIRYNANVNAQDEEGDTPIHDAVAKENIDIVDILIASQRVDYKLKNKKGLNVLHAATIKNNKIALEKLIKAAPLLVNVQITDGITALHLASSEGLTRLVDILINTGHANFEMTATNGVTPLLAAVSKGHASVIELLINKGANVSADDQDGDTALHIILIHILGAQLNIFDRDAHLNTSDLSKAPAINKVEQTLPRFIKANRVWLAIACFLISHGANLEHLNHSGVSPLQSVNDPRVADVLKQHVKPTTPSKPATLPKPSLVPMVAAAEQETKCMVCKSARPNYTFRPCGHSVVCAECIKGMKECCFCRMEIQEKVKKTVLPFNKRKSDIPGNETTSDQPTQRRTNPLESMPVEKVAVSEKKPAASKPASQVIVSESTPVKNASGPTRTTAASPAQGTESKLKSVNATSVQAPGSKTPKSPDLEIKSKDTPVKAAPITGTPPPTTPTSAGPGIESVNCTKCDTNPRNVLLLLCGHSCCSQCSTPMNQCHVCGSDIVQKIQLF